MGAINNNGDTEMKNMSLHKEELDGYALNNAGVIPQSVVRNRLNRSLPQPQHGYSFKRVIFHGEGAEIFIIRGETAETRRKIWLGKAKPLLENGIPENVAKAYLRGKHVNEAKIMAAFIETWLSPAWAYTPEKVGGVIPHYKMISFIKEWGFENIMGGMPCPRFTALADAIERCRVIKPV